MVEEKKQRLSTIVPQTMAEWLKIESQKRGISVNALVNFILSETKTKWTDKV